MSKDMDKLAAEMKNIKPSKSSRKSGMDAALAAFDKEFAEGVEKEGVAEINSQPSQGSADAPRLTGQNTRTGRVQAFGSTTMRKINTIFSFTPKTKMMMGSCAAALMATVFILPLATDSIYAPELEEKFDNISSAMEPADEIITTGSKSSSDIANVVSPKPVDKVNEIAKDAPETGGGINSVSKLLDKVRSDADAQAKSAGKRNLPRENQAVVVQKQNAQLFAAQQNVRLTDPRRTIRRRPLSTPTSAPNKSTNVGSGGLVLEEVPAQYRTETKTIVTKEASTELVMTPPVFETVTETVVVQPAGTELVVMPPEYKWVEGEIEGSTVEYETTPAEYETVTEPVVVQEAKTEVVSIPAIYNSDGTVATPASIQERVIPSVTKMESRRVVKKPASTVERVVPYEIKDGKTRVAVKPATVVERKKPVGTKQVSRRIVKTPASTMERIIPAGTRKEVAVKTEVSPQRFYLRDENDNVVREFASRDQFEKYMSNLATSVKEKPVSTFSIDVDTISYSFFRNSINRGQLPPRNSIRLEEMINYFPYDYEAPRSADEPFKANVTVTPTPWNADTKLMHVGIKGYVPPATERPDSNIVLLIDTSGSMNQPNKLPLLINSFKLLLNTLDEDDTVSIVTYAGSAGTVLEPTPASEKGEINAALNRLRAGGSTAGAAGLELAYMKAAESFDEDGVNRVILATDGDFNVGFSSPDEMKTFIEKKRKTGVFLSVLGFGNGNYNDHLMQSLAQNGNGVAAYIDSLAEANKVLADEAGSALITIAKDVKIQVEFNPDTISEYRLIGYETRALKREDFNNDKVDAGEIGAGHSVTAIYELTPVGSPARTVDDLRYVSADADDNTTGSDEFAFVKIRHKLPNADKSTLQTFPIGPGKERSLKRASDDMRFATAVAAVGQKLRGDTQLDSFSYDDAIKLATDAKGDDENGYRAEFIQLVRLMDVLQ